MKTVGSRIVIVVIFGTVYYAADRVLAQVELTIDQTVTTNLLVSRRHLEASGLSGAIIGTGKTLGEALSGNDLSLTQNVSGADNGSLKEY